jgi:hypothetical protein
MGHFPGSNKRVLLGFEIFENAIDDASATYAMAAVG